MPPQKFQDVMKVVRQRVRDADGKMSDPAVIAEKEAVIVVGAGNTTAALLAWKRFGLGTDRSPS